MTDTPVEAPRSRSARSFLRRWIYPAATILAIAGIIWWIESRGDEDVSSTGERYGPVEMPSQLLTTGVDIGTDAGDMAPNFLLQDMDGEERMLSDFRGQPIVLNFWATWCAPCRKEMPQFVRAYDEHADEGLVVIGLNLQESESIIEPFATDYGVKFPILIDRDGEVGDDYRTTGVPETFFIDSDGVIREHFIGPFEAEDNGENVQGAIDQTELEAKIEQILTTEAEDDGSG